MVEKGIGQPVPRKEDRRFVTGRGRYTDDINLPGQLHAVFVRSPHAHARIRRIDKDSVLGMPGVVAVLTGADAEADGIGPLICGWMIHSRDGSPMKMGTHRVLATDKVRYVGDRVACIVAETPHQARDAAEALVVEYEELEPVVDLATAHDAPARVHDDIPHNLCYDWELGDRAAVDEAFARAAKVVSLDLTNNRLVPNAMEPRAALAAYDPGKDEITLYLTSQNPHVHRLVMSAFNNIAPEHKLRVVAPDVGGGFGSKIFIYGEECVVAWAARRLGRPVKWREERSEAFLADAHGRDHLTRAEMAVDQDGRILALRVDTKANLGAYMSTFSSAIPTYLYAPLLSGQYRIPAIYARVRTYYTNTTPVDAYRGAGRPEACYVVETLVDAAARELGLDRAEIRRRNFIPKDAFPYETPVIMTYDSGDYATCLERALELADYAGFEQRRREAAARGKLRGIGIACYIEACGIAPSQAAISLGAGVGLWESAEVRFTHTGKVQVFTGTHTHGQGHETTFSQLVAEALGVPFEDVEVIHGDTAATPVGMGTYGSRSQAVGGEAILRACNKIIEKGKKIAAHLLEASEADIEFEAGTFRVKGTDRQKTIQEVAFAAYVPSSYPPDLEPGLEASAFFDPPNFTFPSGTYVCEVEVDPETGQVSVEKWVAVDDFGRVINPLIVEGQVHGGVVQGLGQALLEHAIYDRESGQLLTGSFMDYAMPRADHVPDFVVEFAPGSPSPSNSLGAKGAGEAGAIGAPPAIMNAIWDAIGVRVEMPATPERVWRALQSVRMPQAAE